MGKLKKLVEDSIHPNLAEWFKENSKKFYNLYQDPDNDTVKPIAISKIKRGGIYFIWYKDESNWMKYSPILVADYRDKKIIFAMNMNFLPLEIRLDFFDDITKNIWDNNNQSHGMNPFHFMTFEKIYKKLIKYGFEYSLVEYDISRIIRVVEIDMENLHEFLYSSHPKNIYDPNKLYQIWKAKYNKRSERHKELIVRTVDDFYNVKDEIIDEVKTLKNHFKRLKRNTEKFGD